MKTPLHNNEETNYRRWRLVIHTLLLHATELQSQEQEQARAVLLDYLTDRERVAGHVVRERCVRALCRRF